MQYRKRLTVRGIVQGVGFRPAIAKEAKKRGLSGTIANARDSVVIEIQGDESLVFDFIEDFYNIIPPNAFIYFLHSETIEPRWEESSFDIIESLDNGPHSL
jgi:hydrogenase maturation protein HypF